MRLLEKTAVKQAQNTRKEILEGIPIEDLPKVVSDFESEGAKVTTQPDPDGNWTLTALFDEQAP